MQLQCYCPNSQQSKQAHAMPGSQPMIYPRPWLTYRYFVADLGTHLLSQAEKKRDSQSAGYPGDTGVSSPWSRSFSILVVSFGLRPPSGTQAGISKRWFSVLVSRTIQILDTKQLMIQKVWVRGIPQPCPRSALITRLQEHNFFFFGSVIPKLLCTAPQLGAVSAPSGGLGPQRLLLMKQEVWLCCHKGRKGDENWVSSHHISASRLGIR